MIVLVQGKRVLGPGLFWEHSHQAPVGVSWDQRPCLIYMALQAAAPSEMEALGKSLPPRGTRGEWRQPPGNVLVASGSLPARQARVSPGSQWN